jgi:hypothetical protein
MVVVRNPSEGKPSMRKSIGNFAAVTPVGLDLAKRIFQVHAVDANGEIMVARKLARGRLVGFFFELPRCAAAMEAPVGTSLGAVIASARLRSEADPARACGRSS